MSADLVARLVSFCRALRARGLPVTTSHAVDAARALRCAGIGDRRLVHLSLRCVLTSRPEEFPVFDELFETAFLRCDPGPRPAGEIRRVAREGAPALTSWSAQADGDEEPEQVPGASDRAAREKKDLAALEADDIDELDRIAARIARRLAARSSRRWKPGRKGARVDLRRTMRRAPANGAELLDLRFRVRKTRKTRIVALCDVSGSMDLYSRLLLRFLHALQGSAARVESFVFSTGLVRVTPLLRGREYAAALRELSAGAHGFSGGTRIGECLSSFNAQWGRLVDARTVVVILSDGWDTGEPSLLSAEMEALKMRSRRLVWLNPLLGSPGYQPLALGMQAALPHLSVFAPAHDLESLRALERHLVA